MSVRESKLNLDEVLEFLKPKPHPFSMIRLGGKGDGAYLVPKETTELVACFSPGVRNRKSFEDDILDKYQIRSHLADFSSSIADLETPLFEPHQTFSKKWISAVNDAESMTLETWIEECEPGVSDGFLLQMDIEGAEYEVLPAVAKETWRNFKIVILELHGLRNLAQEGAVNQRFEPAFRALIRNFDVIHSHPNNCCGWSPPIGSDRLRVPSTLELTLVSKSWLKELNKNGREFLPPVLPNPLDIYANVPAKKPMHLLGKWSGSRTNALGYLVAIRDWCRYLLFWSWKRLVPSSISRAVQALSRS